MNSSSAAASRAREDTLPEPMAAFLAAARNDIEEARRLMEQIHSPDDLIHVPSLKCGRCCVRNRKFSPLMLAAHAGNDAACSLLLASCPDAAFQMLLNTCDFDTIQPCKWSAYSLAASKGHTSTCSLLGDTTASLFYGSSALSFAVEGGHADMCAHLLEQNTFYLPAEEEEWGQTLHQAASCGSIATFELILRHCRSGVPEDVADEFLAVLHGTVPCETPTPAMKDGITPLIVMAATDNTEAVKGLIDDGADVNAATSWGWTPLMSAARHGKTETIALLLAAGSATDSSTNQNFTALSEAASAGYTDAVRLLLSPTGSAATEPRVGASALVLASQNGDLDMVRLLLQSGIAVDSTTSDGTTSLMCAAANDDLEMMSILFERGADIHATDQRGSTPLMRAARAGQADTIRTLLRRGAVVDHARNDGWTALFVAAAFGHAEAVRVLLSGGAAVNKTLRDKRTSLMLAVSEGHERVVRALLESGADIDMESKNGSCAMMEALRNYNIYPGIFRLLTPAPNSCGRSGVPPLVLAAQCGSLGAIRELVARGALVDFMGRHGRTPLQEAAAHARTEAALLLLQSGASINKQMHDGGTALSLASKTWGGGPVFEQLLDADADANRGMKDGSTVILQRYPFWHDMVLQKTAEMAVQSETHV